MSSINSNLKEFDYFPNDLIPLLQFAKWEYDFIDSLNLKANIKIKLYLIDKEWLRQYKEIIGYTSFRSQLLHYISCKKQNNLNITELNNKLINSWINNKKSSSTNMKIPLHSNKNILSTNDNKTYFINGLSNFAIIPENLVNNFKIFSNKNENFIKAEGIFSKGKLLIPLNMNNKNDFEVFINMYYINNNINNKHAIDEVLFTLPKIDINIQNSIFIYLLNELIEKLIPNIKNEMCFNNNGNLIKYKAIFKNKIQSKNINNTSNENDLIKKINEIENENKKLQTMKEDLENRKKIFNQNKNNFIKDKKLFDEEKNSFYLKNSNNVIDINYKKDLDILNDLEYKTKQLTEQIQLYKIKDSELNEEYKNFRANNPNIKKEILNQKEKNLIILENNLKEIENSNSKNQKNILNKQKELETKKKILKQKELSIAEETNNELDDEIELLEKELKNNYTIQQNNTEIRKKLIPNNRLTLFQSCLIPSNNIFNKDNNNKFKITK